MDDITTTGQKWAAAESSGDTGELADLVTDDFRVVGPGGFSPESVAWDDVIVRDYGTAAVTIATVTQKASFQGQRADGQFRVAHVFVRPGERWQIANVQYSMIGGPSPFARPGA